MNNEEKSKWVNATKEQKRLSKEYRDFLLRSLTELDVDVKQLTKYTWLELETMLMIDLGEQPRRGFDGELCRDCSLVFRRFKMPQRCPRCGLRQ